MQSTHDGHTLVFHNSHPGEHYYTLDGKEVPGVTTMIKGSLPTSPALTSWMAGQAAEFMWDKLTAPDRPLYKQLDLIKEAKSAFKKKSGEAAGIGTLVHDYCYFRELNEQDSAAVIRESALGRPDFAKFNNAIAKFEEWKAENKDEQIIAEQVVASIKHKFAGKFDRLAIRGGKRLVLSDFKTSSGIYSDMFVQLGAYAIAIEEWMGKEVDEVEILRFGKAGGEFEVRGFKAKSAIKAFKDQAIRCRETFEFTDKWGKKIRGK